MKNTTNKNNNFIFIIGFALIILLISGSLMRAFLARPKNSGSQDIDKKINEEILKAPLIRTDELVNSLKSDSRDLYILDLRGSPEFSAGHILLSKNIQNGELSKGKLLSLGANTNSEIILLNQGSNVFETAQKTNELISAGFKNAKYLQGGIDFWIQSGNSLISTGDSNIDSGKIKRISFNDLAVDIFYSPNFIKFIDVRSQNEFKKERIPGALNIPANELETRHSEVPSASKIVIYADDENQASAAAVTLFDLNFFNAYVLEGGLAAWKAGQGKTEISK